MPEIAFCASSDGGRAPQPGLGLRGAEIHTCESLWNEWPPGLPVERLVYAFIPLKIMRNPCLCLRHAPIGNCNRYGGEAGVKASVRVEWGEVESVKSCIAMVTSAQHKHWSGIFIKSRHGHNSHPEAQLPGQLATHVEPERTRAVYLKSWRAGELGSEVCQLSLGIGIKTDEHARRIMPKPTEGRRWTKQVAIPCTDLLRRVDWRESKKIMRVWNQC